MGADRGPRDALRDGFVRRCAESRFRRVLCPVPELAPRRVAYLTRADHHDHAALVTLDAASGERVGVARLIRCPEARDAAEMAIAVFDEWHGRGVGTALVALLIDGAREVGIGRCTALVLAQDGNRLPATPRAAGAGTVDLHPDARLAAAGRPT